MKYKLFLLLICLSFSILKASEAEDLTIDTEDKSTMICGIATLFENQFAIKCILFINGRNITRLYVISKTSPKYQFTKDAYYELQVKILLNTETHLLVELVKVNKEVIPLSKCLIS